MISARLVYIQTYNELIATHLLLNTLLSVCQLHVSESMKGTQQTERQMTFFRWWNWFDDV